MIATTLSPELAHGMTQQVKRVNKRTESETTLRQRIAELETEVRRLQALLQLQERHDDQTSRISAGGRELITPSEAARAHGVSLATINRALNGWGSYRLDGIQMSNGRWMVYADSTLVKPNRRKRKTE